MSTARPRTVGSQRTAGSPRAAGRPRDPRVDEAVRAAVLDLLVEQGYDAVTVQGVARRAGVGAPAIYRRWPSKVDMVEAAVFRGGWTPPVATGDRAADLRRLAGGILDGLVRPATRAAIPGLLVAYQADPARHRRLVARAQRPVQAAFDTLLADVDAPLRRSLFRVFNGALIAHALLSGATGRRRAEREAAEVVLRATR